MSDAAPVLTPSAYFKLCNIESVMSVKLSHAPRSRLWGFLSPSSLEQQTYFRP